MQAEKLAGDLNKLKSLRENIDIKITSRLNSLLNIIDQYSEYQVLELL